MSYVLVCEDESAIRDFIVINLKRHNFDVLEASSGEEAVTLYEQYGDEIVVALLDVMLPGIDGFHVCKMLRERSLTLGIIMLTARSQEIEKIGALKLGADDYITKPFSPSELLARIEALLRRMSLPKYSGIQSFPDVHCGCFTMDFRNRVLLKNNTPIELTQVEFQMVQYFLQNAEKPLNRTDILHHVWGDDYCGEEKVVDVNIRRLRMKIEDDPSQPRYIQTVWGCGYRWNVT